MRPAPHFPQRRRERRRRRSTSHSRTSRRVSDLSLHLILSPCTRLRFHLDCRRRRQLGLSLGLSLRVEDQNVLEERTFDAALVLKNVGTDKPGGLEDSGDETWITGTMNGYPGNYLP